MCKMIDLTEDSPYANKHSELLVCTDMCAKQL
jgi:hypothetical protein